MIQITTDRKVASIATVNVENDKDVVKLEFTCPNQVTPQLKLTDCDKVYINYSNADVPDRYLVTDLTSGEGEQADTVTFSWLLGRNAVHSSGSTYFVVCAQKLDAAGEIAQEWNTELTSFKVHRGLETLQQPVKPYEDIFSQIFSDLAKKLIVENIIAGNNVTLDVSGNNITINAEGGATVEVDNVTLENDEGTLKVKPGGIGNAQLSAAVLNLINNKATQFRTLYTPQASGVRAQDIPTGVYEAAAAFTLIIGYGTTYESQININQGDSFYVAFLGSPSYVEGYVIGENLTAFLFSNSDDGVLVFTITDIPTLALALSSEVDARIAGDNNLQTQIDAITVSSDVIDVVGTYTDLQNYDTAHVKANDIIKVMQDSTHSNAISYYRWVITGGVGAWTYVGSEGPYYTKGETDQLLQAKLDASVIVQEEGNNTDKVMSQAATTALVDNTIGDAMIQILGGVIV